MLLSSSASRRMRCLQQGVRRAGGGGAAASAARVRANRFPEHPDRAGILQRLRKRARWTAEEAAANEARDAALAKTRLVSAAVVERLPRVMPEPGPATRRWLEVWQRRRADELSRRPTVPAKMLENDTTVPLSQPGGAVDEEKEAFLKPPLPLVTAADEAGDRRSTNRRLDRRLFLLVKKDRAEHAWQFPQGGLEGDETLRAAAERELAEETALSHAGGDVYFLSNAPAGHLEYQYPPEARRDGFEGARVFFLPATYMGGEPRLKEDEVVDYVWAAKDELGDYLSGDLLRLANEMLME